MVESVTYKEVCRRYPAAKAEADRINTPYSYYVLGRLSLRLVPFFLRRGFAPNTITTLCMGCMLVGLALVLLGAVSRWLMVCGALCLNMAMMLDNVDGHVARFRDQCTRLGDFFDGMLSSIHYGLLPICLGLALYFGGPEPYEARLGIAIAPSAWLVLAVLRMFVSEATITVTVRGRALLEQRRYDLRVHSKRLLALANWVAEGEVALLLFVPLLGLLGPMHVFYTLFHIAGLAAATIQNGRDLAAADKADECERGAS